MTTHTDRDRFQKDASKYAAYLGSVEGRLRLDLAFASLVGFFPPPKSSLRALDLGGGTGAMAVRLAQRGFHVTLLDSAQSTLDLAERGANDAGVRDKIALLHGDAGQIENLFAPDSFDLILCHNIFEYVDDPPAVLRGAAGALRAPSAIISVLVRNRAGEIMKSAIKDGDLNSTEHNLTAEWGTESLYGGRVRLFSPESLRSMMQQASLEITSEFGVRVLSDYLPARVSRNENYGRILELERKLGEQPEFVTIARYIQFLARRTGPAIENGV